MVDSFIPCCACYINLQSSNPLQVQTRPPFSFAAKARWPSESKAELLAECAGRSQFISIPGCFWAQSSLPYSSGLMFGLMRIVVSKVQGGGLLWGHTHTHSMCALGAMQCLLSNAAYKFVNISFFSWRDGATHNSVPDSKWGPLRRRGLC